MIKVGITGQSGFMGTHLFNFLGLKSDIQRIEFEDGFFRTPSALDAFVTSCDVIIHLAAMNRHEDENVVYQTNINLTMKLLEACDRTESTPHIIFSSSTQEARDNLYGKSKRECRKILEKWAGHSGARFTGMIIPNVFGPFGQPFYNSVVATFCHQIAHGGRPEIHVDGELKLIYINELTEEFYHQIVTDQGPGINKYPVPHTAVRKVSAILNLLEQYRQDYLGKGVIPDLSMAFERALFNTFRCYVEEHHFPVNYQRHTDQRGSFVEIIRANTKGQFSYSTTKPGVTRGNHFHTRKAERFAVIRGHAKIRMRRIGSDAILEYDLSGDSPAFVDMPIWHTHNLTNTGNGELITLFWISEPYDPDDPDTYYEDVD
jgi:UDP-2-acetamido-2,6-beta-L-arabino-hexul-4-ose reductase